MYALSLDSHRLRRLRPASPWKLYGRRAAMGVVVFAFTVFAMAQAVHGSAASGYMEVTVQPGDTVWSIASARYPGADTRDKVQEILQANDLRSPEIHPGEQLKVPSS